MRYGLVRLKLRGFSWDHFRLLRGSRPLAPYPRLMAGGFAYQPSTVQGPGLPTPGRSSLLRYPIASAAGTGILTCFPSGTRFRLPLGADSPCVDERCAGNLGLTATRPFTLFIATHVSIRTSDTSSSPHEPPSQAYGTLSYHQRTED